MGMKLFSDNRSDPAPSDPVPTNFMVTFAHAIGTYTLAEIIYPTCNTFEGKKILVFDGDRVQDILSASKIDPHFNVDGLAPIARFAPTERGLALAMLFCQGVTA